MKIKPRFSLSAISAAVFTTLGQMLTGPSGRAAQWGRLDLTGEDGKAVMKAFDDVESTIKSFTEKARGELDTVGKTSKETLEALDKIGKSQLELAKRLQEVEQSGSRKKEDEAAYKSLGEQFIDTPQFKAFDSGSVSKVRAEIALKVKNTVLEGPGNGSNAAVMPDRQPGIVRGAFRPLRVEQMLNSVDTVSNAIQYTKELSFVNNAAETAEAAQKPETNMTFSLVTQPVQTVAHWIKISRQLAKDAPALTAYINVRMMYGVNKRAEDQIIGGNGIDPNISGLLATGNFTSHGYTSAALGTVNAKIKLVRRMIADLAASDYPADLIMLNPSDWADIELYTTTYGEYIIGDPQTLAQPMLWGLPVVATNAIPLGTVIVMSGLAATVYNREAVVIEMSESDADNFTKNLITIRAERRLALAVEIPAAVRAGTLNPA